MIITNDKLHERILQGLTDYTHQATNMSWSNCNKHSKAMAKLIMKIIEVRDNVNKAD